MLSVRLFPRRRFCQLADFISVGVPLNPSDPHAQGAAETQGEYFGMRLLGTTVVNAKLSLMNRSFTVV